MYSNMFKGFSPKDSTSFFIFNRTTTHCSVAKPLLKGINDTDAYEIGETVLDR